VVFFTSPRSVEAYVQMMDQHPALSLKTAKVVAIGSTTARAIAEAGLPAPRVATTPTALGLVEAAIG
jgi:uroporphyrinogen-III synthase